MQAPAVVAEIRSLWAEGLNKQQIASRLGIHRQTVARYLAEDPPPTGRRRARGRLVDPYLEHLQRRLAEYPELTAAQLHREISRDGYRGAQRTARRTVAAMRAQAAGKAPPR